MSEFAGHLRLRGVVRSNGRTVLAEQSFRAPFHLSKAYWDVESEVLLVQVVNPTAGILSGDRLESDITVDEGAALLVTTPSASRVFKMDTGTAECRQHFVVARGGWLEFLPEPLVPHRGSCYQQRTTIDVVTGGSVFFVDQLMPGRTGHGEVWQWNKLSFEVSVRIDGELVVRERLQQSGDSLRRLAELAGSGPAACFANAILIAPAQTPPATWPATVSALHGDGLWVGVTALRYGGWTLKLIANDAVRLRQGVRDVRMLLAEHFPRLRCDLRKL